MQREYEELAVELGLNHAKRLNLRARLKAVRMTCPLFDTAQWVQDLEKVRLWVLADLQGQESSAKCGKSSKLLACCRSQLRLHYRAESGMGLTASSINQSINYTFPAWCWVCVQGDPVSCFSMILYPELIAPSSVAASDSLNPPSHSPSSTWAACPCWPCLGVGCASAFVGV